MVFLKDGRAIHQENGNQNKGCTDILLDKIGFETKDIIRNLEGH